MTGPQRPVIRFKRNTASVNVVCTCRYRTLEKSDDAARDAAQQHSDYHWSVGDRTTIELGGLL